MHPALAKVGLEWAKFSGDAKDACHAREGARRRWEARRGPFGDLKRSCKPCSTSIRVVADPWQGRDVAGEAVTQGVPGGALPCLRRWQGRTIWKGGNLRSKIFVHGEQANGGGGHGSSQLARNTSAISLPLLISMPSACGRRPSRSSPPDAGAFPAPESPRMRKPSHRDPSHARPRA